MNKPPLLSLVVLFLQWRAVGGDGLPLVGEIRRSVDPEEWAPIYDRTGWKDELFFDPAYGGRKGPTRAQRLASAARGGRIFVGVVSFRDGRRCGRSLYQMFRNASQPERVFPVVLEQLSSRGAGDVRCLDAYAALVSSAPAATAGAGDRGSGTTGGSSSSSSSSSSGGGGGGGGGSGKMVDGCDEFCAQVLSRAVPHESASGPVTARAALHPLMAKWRRHVEWGEPLPPDDDDDDDAWFRLDDDEEDDDEEEDDDDKEEDDEDKEHDDDLQQGSGSAGAAGNESAGAGAGASASAASSSRSSFCLQVDSHMFFARGWDEGLLGSWARTGNPKAVLTTYAPPPPYVGVPADEVGQSVGRSVGRRRTMYSLPL
jgi:hypothetical protein